MEKRIVMVGCIFLLTVVAFMKFSSVNAGTYKDYDEFEKELEKAVNPLDFYNVVNEAVVDGDLYKWLFVEGKKDHFMKKFFNTMSLDTLEKFEGAVMLLVGNADIKGIKTQAIDHLTNEFLKPDLLPLALFLEPLDAYRVDLISALLDKKPEILFLELDQGITGIKGLNIVTNTFYLLKTGRAIEPQLVSKMAEIFQKASPTQQNIAVTASKQFAKEFGKKEGDVLYLKDFLSSDAGDIVLDNGKKVSEAFALAPFDMTILGQALSDI